MITPRDKTDYYDSFYLEGIYDYCYDCRLFKCFGKPFNVIYVCFEQWLGQWRINVEKRAGAV